LKNDVFGRSAGVIALRLIKLANGGPAAQKEGRTMIQEKLVASVEAAATLAWWFDRFGPALLSHHHADQQQETFQKR
jgi:hypothetical protein